MRGSAKVRISFAGLPCVMSRTFAILFSSSPGLCRSRPPFLSVLEPRTLRPAFRFLPKKGTRPPDRHLLRQRSGRCVPICQRVSYHTARGRASDSAEFSRKNPPLCAGTAGEESFWEAVTSERPPAWQARAAGLLRKDVVDGAVLPDHGERYLGQKLVKNFNETVHRGLAMPV